MTDAALRNGMRIPRRFTRPGQDPFETIDWERRDSRITNPDGSIVFEMLGAEVPANWSQVATDIIVSKYFRKAGVPQLDDEGNTILDADGTPQLGPERSARQTIGRLAATWRAWGEDNGYFASADDAQTFQDELAYMLVHQIASPNSPQWFNTGLNLAYGLTGPAQGFWYVDPDTEEAVLAEDSYTRPAPHACFPAGTMIMTSAGSIPIDKVQPGDRVLTHTGRIRTVSDIMQRQVDEDLVRVSMRKLSAEDLVATTNHPVLAVRGTDAKLARSGVDISPEWIDAGDLQSGDFVVVASPSSAEETPPPIDLADTLGSNFEIGDDTITTRNSAHRPELKRFIDFADPSAMRLFGHWLGDGSIGHETRDGARASVNFVFDADDEESIDDITVLMRKTFGLTTSLERATGQRTAHLRYTRRPLAAWFADTFGEGFANKRIPAFVYDLPREHRIQLLVGLFRSDGCVHRAPGYLGMNFDQSNRALAEGIWRVARSLGYAPAFTGGDIRPGGTVPHYRIQISAKDATDLAAACGLKAPKQDSAGSELRVGDQVAYRVTAVAREPFYGTVYNFQVDEDESYIANGVAVHNCFIQAVEDDLVNEGGIMDLWLREARLFKFGSGTGTNFSKIRGEGERLSGGGRSSGIMSFLKIGDRAAGAIKSGGTTRRAAKMVILDLDHPDIEEFISWKMEEENKVRALIASGYDSDFNGEAYQTVSGQNSNNSVRVPTDFIEAVLNDEMWALTARKDGEVMKKLKARDLWRQIAEAAWACADPGVQFDTTINEWHTSPAEGPIRASNPCSEYMFLDNTACNLASLNLVKFYDDEEQAFDIDAYLHAIRLWTMVLEISVTMAQFPSKEIAEGSYNYRTLGLGYANLGSLLMRTGIPYDSDEGRAIAGTLTAILTGHSYATSAEMASVLGPFAKYELNKDSMLRVIRNHRQAAYNADREEYDGISHYVMGIDPDLAPADLLQTAQLVWDNALNMGEQHGFRNAQSTVLAPTGTIGLQMDCDTTGVEPDFALVKFKKLAGGGYFKIANQSIAPALRHLGYTTDQIDEIVDYVVGTMTLLGAPGVNRASLTSKGFSAEDLRNIDEILPGVFELNHAFNVFVLGEATMQRLGFTEEQYTSFDFDMLRALGFSTDDIRAANDVICGRQTIEGAPYLRDEHLPVFDTANRNGKHGRRFIHHNGHIKMMAAAQPFISGAISKTINMPNEVTVEDIEGSYMLSAELGLKSMALYRDGSKASQPLSATSDEGEHPDDELEGLPEALEDEARIVKGTAPAIQFAPGVSPTMAYQGMSRPRFLLPARRHGFTQEARVGGHKLFVRTGEYEDGTLGELFIDLAKEGATLRGVLSCFAIAVSKGLQYGVPLDEFVDTFTFQTFEPRGIVEGHPNIKMANSIVDYVFRALGMEYLGRTDLVQVPPTETRALPEPPKGIATQTGYQLGLEEAKMEDDIDAQTRAAAFVDAEVVDITDSSPTAAAATPVATPTSKPPASNNLANGTSAGATNGKPATQATAVMTASDAQTSSVQAALAANMGDAPLCDTCGHITVRNGSCYRCMNCGDSKGCS